MGNLIFCQNNETEELDNSKIESSKTKRKNLSISQDSYHQQQTHSLKNPLSIKLQDDKLNDQKQSCNIDQNIDIIADKKLISSDQTFNKKQLKNGDIVKLYNFSTKKYLHTNDVQFRNKEKYNTTDNCDRQNCKYDFWTVKKKIHQDQQLNYQSLNSEGFIYSEDEIQLFNNETKKYLCSKLKYEDEEFQFQEVFTTEKNVEQSIWQIQIIDLQKLTKKFTSHKDKCAYFLSYIRLIHQQTMGALHSNCMNRQKQNNNYVSVCFNNDVQDIWQIQKI